MYRKKGIKVVKVKSRRKHLKKIQYIEIIHTKGNKKEDNSIQTRTIREMMRNHQCIYIPGIILYYTISYYINTLKMPKMWLTLKFEYIWRILIIFKGYLNVCDVLWMYLDREKEFIASSILCCFDNK